MINLTTGWTWVLLLTSIGFVNAQRTDLFKDLSAKVLFVDYSMFNGEKGLKSTYGLEFSYRQQLNRFMAVAAPLKLSVVNVPGMLTNQTGISLDALLHVFPLSQQARWSPYLLGGLGRAWESGTNGHWQLPVGLGFNRRITDDLLLGLQAEYRAASTEKRNNLQLAAGYVYRIGGVADADGDGVANAEDACPRVKGSPTAKGCPDEDGDGVPDDQDACPGLQGDQKLAGCPDTDGDGLADIEDACPRAAGKAEDQGCPDTDGDGLTDQLDACPAVAGLVEDKGCPPLDTDGDGLADAIDQCPEEKGSAVTNGCPDGDGDGFSDGKDRCPELAGTLEGCPDTDGDGIDDAGDRCPDEAGTVATMGCPEIKQEVREVLNQAMRAVQFESGKDVLLESSNSILDQIAAIMKEYPAYQLVISGHTDDVGDENANLRLSEGRAKACFEYLRGKDVPLSRLSYAGYGESQPVADNASPEGRALNRRVEFDLIIQ